MTAADWTGIGLNVAAINLLCWLVTARSQWARAILAGVAVLALTLGARLQAWEVAAQLSPPRVLATCSDTPNMQYLFGRR